MQSLKQKDGESDKAKKTFQDAIGAAETITDDYRKAKSLSNIAASQAKAGYTEGAIATFQDAISAAEKITPLNCENQALFPIPDAEEVEAPKHQVLEYIAVAQGKARFIEGAIATARMITSSINKVPALIAIAVAQAKKRLF